MTQNPFGIMAAAEVELDPTHFDSPLAYITTLFRDAPRTTETRFEIHQAIVYYLECFFEANEEEISGGTIEELADMIMEDLRIQ